MGLTLPTHPVPKPPHGLLNYKVTNGIKMILNRKVDSLKNSHTAIILQGARATILIRAQHSTRVK